MRVDLEGRVRNIELPRTRSLLPLFEAVINAFDAIGELPKPRGRVLINVSRYPSQRRTEGEDDLGPVSGFSIEDNGVGFTNANFASFETTDSGRKLDRGGKGVGRLLWLKAFSVIEIDSTYSESGRWHRRRFRFSLPDGITDEQLEAASEGPLRTTVNLTGLRPEFREMCPRELNAISRGIMEHTLIRLLDPSCPEIIVSDEFDSININDRFQQTVGESVTRSRANVKGHGINIDTFRLRKSPDPNNRLHFTAHGREVRTEGLSDHLPDLGSKLPGSEGPTVVSCYVSGEILDKHVNSERTAFTLPLESLHLLPGEVAISDVRSAAVSELRSQLGSELEDLHRKKIDQIRNYVSKKAPRYRHLLKANRAELDSIPAGLNDERLESELHKLNYQVESNALRTASALLGPNGGPDKPDYDRRMREAMDVVSDVGRSKLADYVCHRRIVLDLLNATLQRSTDGKYALEDAVHGLIFPLKVTSSDVPLDNQNLWIIDERLAYHEYLASDMPLDAYEILEIDGKKRPDLAIFGPAFATVDSAPPFGSVVIIEFKRPMRSTVPEDDNPLAQVLNYVRLIRSGDATDKAGRPISVGDSVPFYGYLIADLTESIRRHAENAGLLPSPDGLGYFGYNQAARAYLEVISYNKLVTDARKRNQAFFDRLQLPAF